MNVVSTHHTLNSLAITALSRVMWVWLATPSVDMALRSSNRKKFFVKIFASDESAKICPAKIFRHTVNIFTGMVAKSLPFHFKFHFVL